MDELLELMRDRDVWRELVVKCCDPLEREGEGERED